VVVIPVKGLQIVVDIIQSMGYNISSAYQSISFRPSYLLLVAEEVEGF